MGRLIGNGYCINDYMCFGYAYFDRVILARIVMRVCITALAGAYVELISHNGNDTVTVPSTNIVVLLILHYIGL